MQRKTGALHLLLAVSIAAVAETTPPRAEAQPCNRQCDPSLRDASGCCPGAAPHPPSPSPGARLGEKCAASRECSGQLVCIDYRCQNPPTSPAPAQPSPPPPPAPPSGPPFDRAAASAALGAISDALWVCKEPGGPTGDGHVTITFAPSGTVVSAVVDQPPYAGTSEGACVAGRFRATRVPPFGGGNLTIGKRFTIDAAAGAPVPEPRPAQPQAPPPPAPSSFYWIGIAWNDHAGFATQKGATRADAEAAALAECNRTAGSCTHSSMVTGERRWCFAVSRKISSNGSTLWTSQGADVQAAINGTSGCQDCALAASGCNDR